MSLDNNTSSNMNDDDENSRMFISNNSEMEMTSTSFENGVNTPFASIEKASLEEECNKRPYLDGTWFVPDLSQSFNGKVCGICQICKEEFNKNCVISGNLNSSSNFKTHLKVSCFKLFCDCIPLSYYF